MLKLRHVTVFVIPEAKIALFSQQDSLALESDISLQFVTMLQLRHVTAFVIPEGKMTLSSQQDSWALECGSDVPPCLLRRLSGGNVS
ncbi:hypothetical protein CEXT_635241 [Caerostris extrusa]|uniref:Uncharacterized protein n=1 Tax=Caerostris extrusa TaxID=172846 RepID=A0AAV4SQH9_CAEEX|nr:hypothetical protein CEXT_635241 [Caerostris extrusa]